MYDSLCRLVEDVGHSTYWHQENRKEDWAKAISRWLRSKGTCIASSFVANFSDSPSVPVHLNSALSTQQLFSGRLHKRRQFEQLWVGLHLSKPELISHIVTNQRGIQKSAS